MGVSEQTAPASRVQASTEAVDWEDVSEDELDGSDGSVESSQAPKNKSALTASSFEILFMHSPFESLIITN
jgi:hypothetical protein